MITAAPESVIVSAQVPLAIKAELKRRAREADRSLSGEVRRALARYLERDVDKEGDPEP